MSWAVACDEKGCTAVVVCPKLGTGGWVAGWVLVTYPDRHRCPEHAPALAGRKEES